MFEPNSIGFGLSDYEREKLTLLLTRANEMRAKMRKHVPPPQTHRHIEQALTVPISKQDTAFVSKTKDK